jgi:hypothetical protein
MALMGRAVTPDGTLATRRWSYFVVKELSSCVIFYHVLLELEVDKSIDYLGRVCALETRRINVNLLVLDMC